MKKKNPYDNFKQKKQNVPPRYGKGKFGNSRVGAQRPGARGK